jgi:hypothetical protein
LDSFSSCKIDGHVCWSADRDSNFIIEFIACLDVMHFDRFCKYFREWCVNPSVWKRDGHPNHVARPESAWHCSSFKRNWYQRLGLSEWALSRQHVSGNRNPGWKINFESPANQRTSVGGRDGC